MAQSTYVYVQHLVCANKLFFESMFVLKSVFLFAKFMST